MQVRAKPFVFVLWDVDTGQLLRTFTGHTTLSAWGIAFSPDGKTIAIKDLEKNIYLLDADTGKHLRTLTGHTSLIWWIVFSPDSRTIATASYDKTIRLWDVNTGQLLRTPIGHTEQIKSVSFSPDGRTIATGSHDKTIRLWDVNTGKLLRTFKNRRRIFSVAFSPDGRISHRFPSFGYPSVGCEYRKTPPNIQRVGQWRWYIIGGVQSGWQDYRSLRSQ